MTLRPLGTGEQTEGISPDEAEATLANLASALFPGGVGDLMQVTWEPVATPPIPPTPISGQESGADGLQQERARLRAAELRFRTLVEQIPAVTFMAVLGEGKNEIYVSPHIESLLGFTQKEWMENPLLWFSQLHPDDRALWYEEFARGCRTGGPFRAECRLITRDERIVWVRGEARLIKDELGRPLFLQGVAFDITESKRAQEVLLREAVQSTEEHYRDLVEQLGAIFWEFDARSQRFAFVSQGAARILGFPPERWLADPEFWITRVYPDDQEQVVNSWRAALASGGDHQFEFRAVTAHDTVVWLQTRAHSPAPPGKNGRALGVILDISERKKWEAELESALASEQLARGEAEMLNRVGRSLAAELELEQLVRVITDAGAELTGAEYAAFVRPTGHGAVTSQFLRTSTVQYTTIAGFPGNDQLLSATLAGATVRVEDLQERSGYAPKSHAREFVVRSFLGIPVVSRSAEVLGGLFFGHPRPARFSARHERLIEGFAAQAAIAVDNAHLYDAAESARKAAETANRMKDEFLATLSHELRTPLHAVLGWAQLLRAAEHNEATRERGLAAIERNARSQAQIIEDLLDVSRIITGKLHLEMELVDLVVVIGSAVDVIKLAADAKQIDVVKRLPQTAIVRGDADRLQQVLSNLLTNAVKFTPKKGHIEVAAEITRGFVSVSVADNGEGIDPALLPYVFDRFRQADSSSTRSHGGLGLGLAIARHLTEMHGGRLRAESAGRGRGAKFTVELPHASVASLRDVPDGKAAVEEELAEASALLRGARVLVVDDEVDSRDLLQSLMTGVGADTYVAGSVNEAMLQVIHRRPDLILCDIGMPHEDGYALLRRLQSMGTSYDRVPVIAVTAYARAEDRHRVMAAGFKAHLGKPISAGELVRVSARLVANRERA